ncbi:MAG: shikimate dehydrogenase [Rubrobacteridae bacterium]|nr:shikimate dehydrogenase [Rubrobacteridae bacterium]
METFAFLVHPMDLDDVVKKYKIAKKISPKMLASVLKRRRPFVLNEITGIKSKTGVEAMGWFIAVPFLPYQFVDLEEDYVIEKIVKACELGRKEGAKIVGLGAFTAIPGGGGKLVAESSSIPVTTGNTYTAVLANEGAKAAAVKMGIDVSSSTLAVVGATGSIGSVSAEVLAEEFGEIVLIGRDLTRLEALKKRVANVNDNVVISTDISAVCSADVIVTVTGAVEAVINPDDVKPGAVVCDVARPRDVAEILIKQRNDVLVIDGGVARIPGNANLGKYGWLPKGIALGCMAETFMLALEKRYENYTIGKEISVLKVKEMSEIAKKHGFKLAGLRSFEKKVSETHIAAVRENARTKSAAV